MYAAALLKAAELHVNLDSPIAPGIAVGRGTALFVAGTCFSPDGELAGLSLALDGTAEPALAFGMPRLDFFRGLHPGLDPYETAGRDRDPQSADDPGLHGYRSGFWGIVPVPPAPPGGSCELTLQATLADGRTATAPLARFTRAAPPAPLRLPWPEGASGARVAICMASYNAPAELLRRQLRSIRAQTHENWVCVISDDGSDPARAAALEAAVAGDPRFTVSLAGRRAGFYENFERALSLAPADAQYVAMADQDDAWYPDKLAVLLAAVQAPGVRLAYSDARIVDRDGTPLADSYWGTRQNNHTDLTSLLVANAVTGAASLFDRALLDDALPFPPAQFAHFHDHWIGLTALALGEIAFVERPLYDYVQHGSASLGHAAATSMTALRDRLVHQRALGERVKMWRLHYFVDVCRLIQFATVLELRGGERIAPGKRRALARFLAAERSLPAAARLGARGARELLRRRPQTLGAEWMLFHAFAWRRLLAASARPRPQRRLRLDAVPPPSFVIKPGRAQPASAADAGVRAVAEKIAPLELAVSEAAPARVNILIPTIDLEYFFGGYIAKMNLASALAARGARVRIVTTDHVPALPHSWRRTVESYSGLGGLFERVEVAFARGGSPLEVSPGDRFVASTWWTAHIADAATRTLGGERFLYLIQEYEPFTFAMGSYAALAQESYRLPHHGLFSSELLRGYFRLHGLGVYADGTAAGDGASDAFQNAITDVPAPSAAELRSRATRKLLVYARPEPHAARNMFELAMLALGRALEGGALGSAWELNGIGTVSAGGRIPVGTAAELTLLPRFDQRGYADVLRDHDVGLALMYTPHPSLVPIEMAAAGMLTVTNTFENKTAEALRAISSNLVAAEPSIDAIAAAIAECAGAVEDHERRAAGSAVDWSRDWESSFHSELLDRVQAALADS